MDRYQLEDIKMMREEAKGVSQSGRYGEAELPDVLQVRDDYQVQGIIINIDP